MRKALEITFAGSEFRVLVCERADLALDKVRAERPDLVIADVSLPPTDGYALCNTIKLISPGLPVLMLSSRHNPFDPIKGAQADDHLDKPFDTQVLLDKAQELVEAGQKRQAAAPKPVAQVGPPRSLMETMIGAASPLTAPPEPTDEPLAASPSAPPPGEPPAASPSAPPPDEPPAGIPEPTGEPEAARRTSDVVRRPSPEAGAEPAAKRGRAGMKTLSFAARPGPGDQKTASDGLPSKDQLRQTMRFAARPTAVATGQSTPRPPPMHRSSAPAEQARPGPTLPGPVGDEPAIGVSAVPTPPPLPPTGFEAAPSTEKAFVDGASKPSVATAADADLGRRLKALGLSAEQVEGVLALSREVIEQVVWEVVPTLAETLIKEEIARLTKD